VGGQDPRRTINLPHSQASGIPTNTLIPYRPIAGSIVSGGVQTLAALLAASMCSSANWSLSQVARLDMLGPNRQEIDCLSPYSDAINKPVSLADGLPSMIIAL
jgi:hypothetical protein